MAMVCHKTIKEAVKWYRLAADQGNAFSQSNLGTMYDRGQRVLQSRVIAFPPF